MILRCLCIVCVLTSLLGDNAQVFQVVDDSGRYRSDILVIVQSLEGQGEIGRYLTDRSGRTPPIQLHNGLYRVIGICPDNSCDMTVKEYLLPMKGPLVLPVVSDAKLSTIRTLDESGAPFPHVLVIVKHTSDDVEITRYLSDEKGNIPPLKLGPRTYRIIATCPYGLCRTTSQEITGGNSASDIVLKIPVQSSDVNGQIVGEPSIHLTLVSSSDQPLASVQVLVRDQQAKWEKWYTTDEHGGVKVGLPSDPAVVVVLYGGRLYEMKSARYVRMPQRKTSHGPFASLLVRP